jgi:hypothetical protein
MLNRADGAKPSESTGAPPEFPVMVVGQMKDELLAPSFLKVSHTCESLLNALTAAKLKDVLSAGMDCTTWYTDINGIDKTREFSKAE